MKKKGLVGVFKNKKRRYPVTGSYRYRLPEFKLKTTCKALKVGT